MSDEERIRHSDATSKALLKKQLKCPDEKKALYSSLYKGKSRSQIKAEAAIRKQLKSEMRLDNSSQYSEDEFKEFASTYGI